jgi:predicted metal-binding membrane protein
MLSRILPISLPPPERLIVLASLAAITLLAWLYLLGMARDMTAAADMGNMPGMAMDDMAMSPAVGSFPMVATMWAVMMAGMMIPSATPMILLYTTVQRKQGKHPVLMSGLFLAGYLFVWGGFAMAAASLQILAVRAALLSPSLSLVSTRVTGVSFLLAAAYEFSPLKNYCLKRCSGPLAFITRHWRPGAKGAISMGTLHGGFCVGCCWMLMLLLFAAGVMNLFWVAALSVLVLLQKVMPAGRWTTNLTGVAMLMTGLVLLVR